MALSFAFLWGASAEMLVYQSGAFMIAYAYGHFNAKDLLKAGFTTMIGIALALAILDLAWWPLFGFSH
jgi:di/tricarboxylate transporter